MKRVEGWVFTYSPYSNKWMTTKRENYSLLFNDISNPLVLRSNKIETLIELIRKTGGDSTKLKRIVNEQY